MKDINLLTLAVFALMLSNCTNSSNQHDSRADGNSKGSDTTVKSSPQPPVQIRAAAISVKYSLDTGKKFFAAHKDLTPAQQKVLMAINRVDSQNLHVLKNLIVPDNLDAALENYLPFPTSVTALKDVQKILLFSYPAQAFAAYERGELVYTGPTNMGRKKDPTPTGLYFTNWKAEQTTSTFNDEWDLKWNFNIENKEGIGFHQYALPGYPASHSCLRLREDDAKYLYNWAEQWELKGTDDVLAKGTPVIVFGSYPFGSPKPWLQLIQNPLALTMTAADLESTMAPYLSEVLAEQEKRTQYLAKTTTK